MNRYFVKSVRKPIPGIGVSNRKSTALSSGSPREGNNKFCLRDRAETALVLLFAIGPIPIGAQN